MTDTDEPGYSASREALDQLPFPTPPVSRAGGAAQLIASNYLANHQERELDPRLKSGGPGQHRDAVAAAIAAAGYVEPAPARLNIIAMGIEHNADLAAAVAQLGLPKRPVRTRSAETVLNRRR